MERRNDIQRLADRAKGSDRAAFAQLMEEYRERLGLLVQSRIQVRGLVGTCSSEDVVQETAARALESVGRFQWQGEDSFFKWLGGIAERVLLEALRKRQRDPKLHLPDVASREPSPSREMRRSERFDRLKAAMEQLSPDHRRVVRLARLEGRQMKEIAQEMNRSTDAVKKLLARALRQLRESFGETESLSLGDRGLSEPSRDHESK